jgi:hypothetical protein
MCISFEFSEIRTRRTPAELLFNRTVMTKVPEMSKFKVPNSLKNRDKEQKQKMKYYADKRMSNDFQ